MIVGKRGKIKESGMRFKREKYKTGVVVCTFNASSWEAEAGGPLS